MRVLVSETDGAASYALVQLLRSNAVIVDHAETGKETINLVAHCNYDLVLIDILLADMDGYEVVRLLRAARIETPVIVQAPAVLPQVSIKAFNIGADDVIFRPYDNLELFARIQAIVRRSKGHRQPPLRCGPVQFHLDSRKVEVNGAPVYLTSKQYAILELLILRKGKIITKEMFLNHLYGGMDEPEDKFIDVLMCKLRKKLAAVGAPNIIRLVWGRGYMLWEQVGAPPPLPDETCEGEFVDDGYRPLISPSRALSVLLGQVGEGQETRPMKDRTASLIVKASGVA